MGDVSFCFKISKSLLIKLTFLGVGLVSYECIFA